LICTLQELEPAAGVLPRERTLALPVFWRYDDSKPRSNGNAVFQFYNCATLKFDEGRMQAQALHCGNQTG
jgi:hypothetical protein